MQAVVIGAGRIGCGFAGQMLRASGVHVVFTVRAPVMVDYFNQVNRYRVRLVNGAESSETVVDGVRAVSTSDPNGVAEEIAKSELIITAVGARNLPDIAALIANGLRRRPAPTNVVAFENLANAGSYLRGLVATHLSADFPLSKHGFSGALVERAVTQRSTNPTASRLLTFVGDPPTNFVVASKSLRKPLPRIKGMIAARDYTAWIRRKLYVFSAGHAACAYLGYLKGYKYIHSAIRDPEIRDAVLAAMAEGQRGLAACYGREFAGDEAELLKIVSRFENAALNDPIERVGRDPQRKLGGEDRLIGAAKLAEAAGIRPEKLALAAAAACFFYNPEDSSVGDLQHQIEVAGLGPALTQICRLDPTQGVGQCVHDAWDQLSHGWHKGNVLLKLDRLMWSCCREP